jgi:hypothetical protein
MEGNEEADNVPGSHHFKDSKPECVEVWDRIIAVNDPVR